MRYKTTMLFLLTIITGSVQAQNRWHKVKEELLFTGAPFSQCHASTIVETTSGKLLVACFGGLHEGNKDVSIWMRSLNGKDTAAHIVADGVVKDTLRYPAWNPVLFQNDKGKLFLYYKVGPNPRDWWGMVKTSADGGKSWSAGERLPKGILGPIKNKPVQLDNGTILSGSSVEEWWGKWKAHIELSADGGNTWKKIKIDTAGFDVIQPSILQYQDGRLQILCRSKQGAVVQAWSADGGNNWSKLSKTSLLNPNSGTDAVTLQNGRQLIVYNPDLPGKDWFNGRSKLRVAESKDGITWTDILTLEDGDKQEYSYPAIIQTNDGLVHITYTYDRKNIKHVVIGQDSN